MIVETRYGTRLACRLIGASRATLHRKRNPKHSLSAYVRISHRRLLDSERQHIIAVLHQERFADLSVREIYATLLDEGIYICSISTMYRILRALGETRERRRIANHPARVKPELIALGPNCVWSWDITKLAGPQKWQWYQLYVIIDVFSRYVVGWRLERNEDGALAEELFADTIANHGVDPINLSVHADNGSAMTAKNLSQLFSDLSITRSHSRPHVSNDNPFSEAQFKTMKYGPAYPERFGNIEQARQWCESFFIWYNEQHHHVGIGLLTPLDVFTGRGEERRAARRHVRGASRTLSTRLARTTAPRESRIYQPTRSSSGISNTGLKVIDTFRRPRLHNARYPRQGH